MELPKGSRLLFKGITGSQAFGTANKHSDIDYKAIYIQSEDDILSNRYIPQIDIDKDFVVYEIRRFLELVSVGNPNVLELLFLPDRCIVETSPEFEYIQAIRETFLSKACYETFSAYARQQLRKATGLNKKFNWEEDKITRKDIQDFAKITDRQDGKTYNLKDWLKLNEYTSDQIGLASMDGVRDGYKLYTDDIKWVNDNHRFGTDFEERHYRGFGDENSNEPRTSQIEKYRINDWKGIVYWNREEYSRHCKQYREYQQWLTNRNEHRTATNKEHGQSYDGKNLNHVVRLIMTAAEIPTQKTINVDRSKEREFLLDIKYGRVNLKQIIEEWSKKAEDLKQLYDESDLPENVDKEMIKDLELKIRKNELPSN